MNIYKVKWSYEYQPSYDYFDSVVVSAISSEQARYVFPIIKKAYDYSWADDATQLDVELLGVLTTDDQSSRVLDSSYNAG